MTLLRPITTQTNQRFKITPVFKAYQYLDTPISNKVYADGSTAYPIATSSMTSVIKNTQPFNGGETRWDSSHTDANRPYVGRENASYALLTATGANGTATIDVGSWDCTNAHYAVFVVRKTATTMTTGSVIARSSAGNEVVKTFDITSLSPGDYSRIIVDLEDTTLYTGSPDLSNITEVEVEIDTNAHALELGMIYSISDRLMIIGSVIDLHFSCIEDATIENTMETAEKMCKNIARDVFGTGRTDQITVTSPNRDLLGYAMASGKVPKKDNMDIVTTINSPSIVRRAISSNTVTTPPGQKIASVSIDGDPYQSGLDAGFTASDLEPGFYFYNGSTSMTFPTGLDGKIPTIDVIDAPVISNYTSTGLETGYYGVMFLVLEGTSGKRDVIKVPRAKLTMASTSLNQSETDKVEYTINMLSDANDIVFQRGLA